MHVPTRFDLGEGIDDGIERGIARARSYMDNPQLAIDDEFRSQVTLVIEDWPDLSTRAVSLFVELATIATIARATYGENRLEVRDFREILEHLIRFLNSWAHR